MKTHDAVALHHAAENVEAEARRFKEALLTLQPTARHQKTELFTLLYPTIVELLNRHVSQKAILGMLQTQGLKLHPSRFKALMAAHAEGTSTRPSGLVGEDKA